MAAESQVVKAPGMVPDELKQEPRSKGITTARKKKPKTRRHHRMLHGLRGIAGLCGILPGRRLHVLGGGRGKRAVYMPLAR